MEHILHRLLHVPDIYEEALQGRGWVPAWAHRCVSLACAVSGRVPSVEKAERSEPRVPDRWTVIDGLLVDLDVVARGVGGVSHPGGRAVLSVAEGIDASVLFHSVHSLAHEELMGRWLQSCAVGKAQDFKEVAAALQGLQPESPFNWSSPLARDLRDRCRRYFAPLAAAQGTSIRRAAKATAPKLLLISLLWAAYAVLFGLWLCGPTLFFVPGAEKAPIFPPASVAAAAGLLLLFPFAGSLATFHSFHDASHGALSSRAWVNELVTYSGFLIAAPHEWRAQHIAGHHAFTNIEGADPDSKHSGRWVHAEEGHRPSLGWVPCIWTIAIPIGLHILASCRLLAARFGFIPPITRGSQERPSMSVASLLAALLQRLVFYVLPVYRFGLVWGGLWAACPAFVFSILFMLNTQLAHLNSETEGEVSGRHSDCWYAHQIATTADFSPHSRIHWFLSGGLNLQVIHHLFPTVDHCHLPGLRVVVADVCRAHGLELHTLDGYLGGLKSHVALLAGSTDTTVAPAVATSGATGSEASSPEGGAGENESSGSLGKPCGQQSSVGDASRAGAVAGASQKARPRVCVVGSGIAGHGAAYFLRSAYEVTLCERDPRAGGHAHTISGPGRSVDVGFQVFNFANYPLLTKLFGELGVETVPSNMSLSVAAHGSDGQSYEWSSQALFPAWRDLISVQSWRRVFEILRFEHLARTALAAGSLGDISLNSWLTAVGLSKQLRDEYLVPMSAALWSCPTEQVLEFPAITVLGFLKNHFMLQRARPPWRTPKERSKDYVCRLHAAIQDAGAAIRTGVEVASLEMGPGGILVRDGHGQPVNGDQPFDRVVLAVHADQAAGILRRSKLPPGDLSKMEDTIGKFRYCPNEVYVHTDSQCMPKNRRCWGAWNVLQMDGAACVTYWINKLQPASPQDQAAGAENDVFVTLNPPAGCIQEATVVEHLVLDHPVLDDNALRAQRRLPDLQGLAGGRVFLCGAWAGYGFHEDGLCSARAACEAMGHDMSEWPIAHGEVQACRCARRRATKVKAE